MPLSLTVTLLGAAVCRAASAVYSGPVPTVTHVVSAYRAAETAPGLAAETAPGLAAAGAYRESCCDKRWTQRLHQTIDGGLDWQCH
jgi:hypothetical protein